LVLNCGSLHFLTGLGKALDGADYIVDKVKKLIVVLYNLLVHRLARQLKKQT